MSCYICENLEAGDTLYASSDWDGGLGLDYIRDIQYCPVCGRKLAEQTEQKTCKTCRHYCEDPDSPKCRDCSIHHGYLYERQRKTQI